MPSSLVGLVASLALAASLASASPVGLRLRAANNTTNTTAPAPACSAGGSGSVRRPAMYNLLPETPDAASAAVSPLEIRHQAGRPRQEQVAVFTGLPAGAKKCTLGWDQGPADARDFRVEGSGLLSVQQLRGPLPAGPVSYGSVAPLVAASDAPIGQPDLTAWNTPDYGNWTHGSWNMDCAAEVYLHVAGSEINGDGYAFLGQDDRNGLFINYQC